MYTPPARVPQPRWLPAPSARPAAARAAPSAHQRFSALMSRPVSSAATTETLLCGRTHTAWHMRPETYGELDSHRRWKASEEHPDAAGTATTGRLPCSIRLYPCARKDGRWLSSMMVLESHREASGQHPDAAGAAQLRDIVQRLIEAVLREEALLPAPVHLQQAPQVARLQQAGWVRLCCFTAGRQQQKTSLIEDAACVGRMCSL